MNFTTSQLAEIDDMVQVGQTPERPPYHQPHIWRAMVREAQNRMGAAPKPPTDRPEGALYWTRRRFQGRLSSKWHAIHQADPDGGPVCREGWARGWDETRILGEGWVTCGHCANKVGKGGR